MRRMVERDGGSQRVRGTEMLSSGERDASRVGPLSIDETYNFKEMLSRGQFDGSSSMGQNIGSFQRVMEENMQVVNRQVVWGPDLLGPHNHRSLGMPSPLNLGPSGSSLEILEIPSFVRDGSTTEVSLELGTTVQEEDNNTPTNNLEGVTV